MAAEQTGVGTSSPSPISLDSASAGTSSFWDRIAKWASEHKAVVYTIAGVTVVATGAGIYYYASAPKNGATAGSTSEKKKAKKDKRKPRKAEEAKSNEEAKAGQSSEV